MQNDTQSPRQVMMRRLMITGIAVLVLAAVITTTVFVLKSLVPKKMTSSAMTVNANETVALYGAPGAITGLSENLYDQQINDGSSVPVIYKSPDHAYAVSTLTPQNVLFYGKNQSAQNDTQAIQEQTNVFMKAKGYKKIANSETGSDSLAYETFVSDDAVCQLISSAVTTPEPGVEAVPVSHQLACTGKEAIEDEYGQTEKLLKLYTGKNLPSYNLATRTLVKEGDKAFAIVKLKNSKPKSPTLLFASVQDKWSFIADLNGSEGESNGKYVITPEIKSKLDDSKYGGFLTRYIVGTTS
jgi:hypothetical protein